MRTTRGDETGIAGWRLACWLGLAVLLFSVAPGGLRAAELVMFDEAGCPWCRKWDAEVGAAYPKSDEGRRAPLRRVHIAQSGDAGIRLASPVNATPTFVLVEGGAEVGRITGYPGNEFFWGMLDELLARLPATPPPVEKPRDARLERPVAGDTWLHVALRQDLIRRH